MFKPDRLSAFSDGVIAIAITLLVLGLEVPSAHKVPEQKLVDYLIESFHPLLGFVSSFLLIGTYWLEHYAIFHGYWGTILKAISWPMCEARPRVVFNSGIFTVSAPSRHSTICSSR